MSKRTGIVIGILLLLGVIWRMNSLPSEIRTTESPSSAGRDVANAANPAPPQAAAQNETVRKSARAQNVNPPQNLNPRAQALEAFVRKQRAAGLDNAAALPPPMQAYQRLPKSKTRRINEKPFQILGVRAVPRAEYSASMGDILFEQNGFAVVALSPAAGEGWQDLAWNNADRPVLVNPANGRLAIVTGTLVVKLKDLAAADRLAAQEQLTVIAKDESTKTVYFRPPADYSLLSGQQRLVKQADVERVEIELYQSRKEPR